MKCLTMLLCSLALASCATLERHPVATAFVAATVVSLVVANGDHRRPQRAADLCAGAPPTTLGCGGGL